MTSVTAAVFAWVVSVVQAADNQVVPTMIGREMPSWMIGREGLLPKVDAEIVDQVRRDLDTMSSGDRTDPEWRRSGEQIEAVRRVAQLGHEASKALVWIYVQEERYGIEDFEIHQNQKRRAHLTSTFERDPIFGQWMLPIVREEMKFLKTNTRWRDSFGVRSFGPVITVYGDEADLAQLVDLQNDYYNSMSERIRPPEVKMDEMLESRRQLRQRLLTEYRTFSEGCWVTLVKLGEVRPGDRPPQPTREVAALGGSQGARPLGRSASGRDGIEAEPGFLWWPWIAGGGVLGLLLWVAFRARE